MSQKRSQQRRGLTSAVAMVLLTSIFTLGATVGLALLRDHLVQQYGDLAVGLDQLDQSFAYDIGIDGNGDGDLEDLVDCVFAASFSDLPNLVDGTGSPDSGIDVTQLPVDEG